MKYMMFLVSMMSVAACSDEEAVDSCVADSDAAIEDTQVDVDDTDLVDNDTDAVVE